MSEKRCPGYLVRPRAGLVSSWVAVVMIIMMIMPITTAQAEYVTLWAMAEGGTITTLSGSGGGGSGGSNNGGGGPCPSPCEEPNPAYDPDHPYPDEQSEPECLPLPEGTEIDGEPCKECDGGGGVRDKEDGLPCIWHQHEDLEFLGCCYSGNCTIEGQCYVVEEEGVSNTPDECPLCLANSDTMYVPTCPYKVETFTYEQASSSCTGHQSYRFEMIPRSISTYCEMTMHPSQIILDIVEAAACIIQCGRFLAGLDPVGGAACFVCLTENGWEPCDVVKSCDEGALEFPILGATHIPEGGPCP